MGANERTGTVLRGRVRVVVAREGRAAEGKLAGYELPVTGRMVLVYIRGYEAGLEGGAAAALKETEPPPGEVLQHL